MKNSALWFAILILPTLAVSCGDKATTNFRNDSLAKSDRYSDINNIILTEGDTIIGYDVEYPIAMAECGGRLFVTFHGNDSLLDIIDAKTGDRISRNFIKGNGPNDFSGLEFMRNAGVYSSTGMEAYDINMLKKANYDLSTDSLYVTPFLFTPAQSINHFGKDRYAAVPISSPTDSDVFFNFYDADGVITESVKRPFTLSESTLEALSGRNMFLVPYLFANPDKKRLLAPMYFMDAVFVLDDTGTIISTCSPGSGNIDFDKAINTLMAGEDYIRYKGGYATPDYCLFVRSLQKLDENKTTDYTSEAEIIKFDWDGNPLATYTIPGSIPRNICTDDNGNLWVMTFDVAENPTNETYYIVRYSM